MSKDLIGHALLDQYVSVKGELERLPQEVDADAALWEIVDQLLLDLHMIRFGYASDGYARFVERRIEEVCEDASVVQRLKDMRL